MPKKVYAVQRRRTVGPYVTMKLFSTRVEAETFLDTVASHDPDYNTGNTHRCNYYRITEEEITEEEE